jgi:hypothetical protein
MNLNIELSLLDKHFFHLNDDEENENVERINLISNICIHDFFSINEVNISNIIKKIPYYINNFNILHDYDFLNIGELNEKIIKRINLNNFKNENKYLIFQYKNNKCIKFNDYLFNSNNTKLFIFKVLHSFSYLLNSLLLLSKNNICFFNVSYENILFNNVNGENPILTNFQTSIQLKKLNDKYITKIIEKINDFSNKPLEVHVLFYLINNDLDTLSYSLNEVIVENFIKNLSILNFFSLSYQTNYKKICLESLKKYINLPKNEIILTILERSDTWDCYSLSYIFLYIICNISRVFHLKDTFFNNFAIMLSKNVISDSSKRESLENTLINYEKLFNQYNDWTYINKLSNTKLKTLFKILSE